MKTVNLKQRYQNAEQLLPWNLAAKLGNTRLIPHWLDDHRFWFKRQFCDQQGNYRQGGHAFVLVDSQALTEAPLFDHQRMAESLSELLKQSIPPTRLPIKTLAFTADGQWRLSLDAEVLPGQQLLIDRQDYRHRLIATDGQPGIRSPDGQQEIITQGHNLRLRESATGVEKALTDNGEAHFAYGACSDYIRVGICANQPLPPAVQWSPDGRYLAVQRIDERQVSDMPLQQSVPADGGVRPLHAECTRADLSGAHSMTRSWLYVLFAFLLVVIISLLRRRACSRVW